MLSSSLKKEKVTIDTELIKDLNLKSKRSVKDPFEKLLSWRYAELLAGGYNEIIWLDATASILQIYSLIFGCERTAG